MIPSSLPLCSISLLSRYIFRIVPITEVFIGSILSIFFLDWVVFHIRKFGDASKSPADRARRVDPDPVGSVSGSKLSILLGPGPKILDPTGSTRGRCRGISKLRDMWHCCLDWKTLPEWLNRLPHVSHV